MALLDYFAGNGILITEGASQAIGIIIFIVSIFHKLKYEYKEDEDTGFGLLTDDSRKSSRILQRKKIIDVHIKRINFCCALTALFSLVEVGLGIKIYYNDLGRSIVHLFEIFFWILPSMFLIVNFNYGLRTKNAKFQLLLKCCALECIIPFVTIYLIFKFKDVYRLQYAETYNTAAIVLGVLISCFSAISINSSIQLDFWSESKSKTKMIDIETLEVNSGFISKLTFFWFTEIINRGVRKILTICDLPELEEGLKTKTTDTYISKKMNSKWNPLLILPGLIWKEMAIQLFYGFLSIIPYFLKPYLFNRILLQMSNASPTLSSIMNLIRDSIYVFLANVLGGIVDAQFYFYGRRASVKTKSGVMCIVSRKIIFLKNTLNTKNIHNTDSVSKVTNIITNDVQRISEAVSYASYLIVLPIRIILSSWIMLRIIGPSAIAGLALIILFSTISAIIGVYVPSVQSSLLKSKEMRMDTTNEVLSSIVGVKILSWEEIYLNVIEKLREREIYQLMKSMAVNLLMNISGFCAVTLPSCAIFWVHIFIQKQELTPVVAFTTLALLTALRFPIQSLIGYAFIVASSCGNLKHINEFMKDEEVDFYIEPSQPDDPCYVGFTGNATFSWSKPHLEDSSSNDTTDTESELQPLITRNKDVPTLVLKDLNISFPRNKFSVIAGPTGAGKSSLISALLGEIYCYSGEVHMPVRKSRPCSGTINDKIDTIGYLDVSYFREIPWLINSTVRQNILLGRSFNLEWYNKVINACALSEDLKSMPDGDNTIVSHGGGSISGGQKSRIALARAIYTDAEVIILDDPISAIDATNVKYIIKECFLELLKNKTLILSTNLFDSCRNVADFVVIMDNGSVKYSGARDDVLSKLNSENYHLGASLPSETQVEPSRLIQGSQNKHMPVSGIGTISLDNLVSGKIRAKYDILQDADKFIPQDGEVILEGSVKSSTYKLYIKAAGSKFYITILLLVFLLVRVVSIGQDVFLKYWTSIGPVDIRDQYFYFRIHVLFGVSAIFSELLKNIVTSCGSILASKRIHSSIIKRIVYAKVKFFETSSIGQIMNRLFQDIKSLDISVMSGISDHIEFCIISMSISILVISTIPIITLVIPFMTLVYTYYSYLYRKTSRELKRLDKTTRSGLYSLFSQFAEGVSEIRIYDAFDYFLKEAHRLQEINNRAYYYNWVANRWLNLRVDVISALITLLVSFGITLLYYYGILSISSAGIALGYSIRLSESLIWTIRTRTNMEIGMSSVERLEQYKEIDLEQPIVREKVEISPEWPERGKIEIKEIFATYNPDEDSPRIVAKGINLTVSPGEKLAIVGAVGSGKSTLMKLLFRLIEPYSGSILIDSVDISGVDIFELRKRITPIPQHPVLFSGTVRWNIDPENKFSDSVIEEALRLTGLSGNPYPPNHGDIIPNSDSFIDINTHISSGGKNLSAGQRQLLCIARAVVHCSKVVIIDEISANIDQQTSDYINNLIINSFSSSTVICISHRIKPLLVYDRIAVMKDGEIVEYGSPSELLTFKTFNKVFRRLCEDAGDLEEYIIASQRKTKNP